MQLRREQRTIHTGTIASRRGRRGVRVGTLIRKVLGHSGRMAPLMAADYRMRERMRAAARVVNRTAITASAATANQTGTVQSPTLSVTP